MTFASLGSRGCAKIVVLCFLWYLISSTNNIVSKIVLNYFPHPLTLSLVQLLSITIYSQPALRCMGVRNGPNFNRDYTLTHIVPLSAGKFFAVLFSHISVWKVPLSYAHTVKATMPLFTVVFGRLLLQQTHSLAVYTSLFPIVAGVALSSFHEVAFDAVGLASALTSTAMFAMMQLFSKKVMIECGVHHLRLLYVLTRWALVMLLPVWLCVDLPRLIASTPHDAWRVRALETSCLLLADGLLSWLQNMVAFTVLHMVAPLTYSVANATKRVAIVGASLALLNNPITWPNVAGMTLALGGVFLYNRAKFADRRAADVGVKESFTSGRGNLLPLSVLDGENQLLRGCAFAPGIIDWADKLRPIYGDGTSSSSSMAAPARSHLRDDRVQPVAVLVS